MVEVFDTAGQLNAEWQPLIACVARVSRLTFGKDTRSGRRARRSAITPARSALMPKPSPAPFALTGELKIAIITFGM